jgi:hypothetical protein
LSFFSFGLTQKTRGEAERSEAKQKVKARIFSGQFPVSILKEKNSLRSDLPIGRQAAFLFTDFQLIDTRFQIRMPKKWAFYSRYRTNPRRV